MIFILTLALLSAPDEAAVSDQVLVRVESLTGEIASDRPPVLGWALVERSTIGPDVAFVEDSILELSGNPVDEPLFSEQWGLANIGAPWAWSRSQGEDMTIAVIDSGIATDHPDLDGRIALNIGEIPGNSIDDDGNGFVDDYDGWDFVEDDNDPTDPSVGHGTEVATVAAAAANGTGIAGMAPGASILVIRACSGACSLFNVAAGIEYAVERGADIINLSLGGAAQPGPLSAAIDLAESQGVVVVAAAGNGGTDLDGMSYVPAGLPNANLISVAATTQSSDLWSGSNRGRSSIDLGAPGYQIMAGTLETLGTHRLVTGTSFAAPHVAGIIALMRSIRPSASPESLIATLGHHGKPVPTLTATTSFGVEVAADAAVSAVGWTDISGTLFDREIVWLDVNEIVKGCNPPANDRYCPDRNLTRGEVATLLTRAIELSPGPVTFTDTDNSAHQHDIAALHAAGITTGCNPPANDQYCPDRYLTRGEIATLLTRALQLPAATVTFTDTDNSAHQHDIAALHAAGITTGCNPPTNDEYCPDRYLTRGEIAALLERALS